MRNLINRYLSLLAIATALLSPGAASAGSVGGMGGATEVTQLMNNTELMAVVSEQAATYGVQLEEYIRAYQEMQQNTAMMRNATEQLKAYAGQEMILSLAKTALVDLSKSAKSHSKLLLADAKTMQAAGMTPSQFYGKVIEGAAAKHEASQKHLDEVIKSHEDLASKSKAVKNLHIENIKCDGNVMCLQGLATQNSQLADVMIEMSGDIKQLLALQLKKESENAIKIGDNAKSADHYSENMKKARVAHDQSIGGSASAVDTASYKMNYDECVKQFGEINCKDLAPK